MAIDASVIGGLKTQNPQIENPQDLYAKALAVRNAQQQGVLGQQQIQEGALNLQNKQIEMTQAQKLRDVLQNAPSIEAALPEIDKINPALGNSTRKSILDNKEAQLKVGEQKANRLGSIAGSIKDENSFHDGILSATGEGLIDQGTASQLLAQGYEASKGKIDQFKQQALGVAQQHTAGLEEIKNQREALAAQQKQLNDVAELENKKADTENKKAELPGITAKSDIEVASANALKSMTRQDWQDTIDATIGDKTSPLYQRTSKQVDLAIKRGDLKGAQSAIKDAGDQLGRVETTVAGAKATAPTKIEVGTAIAGAGDTLKQKEAGRAAYLKSSEELNQSKAASDTLSNLIDLSKSGNKAAARDVQTAAQEALNAFQGIRRNNQAQLSNLPGSFLDKFEGKLRDVISGAPMTDEVMQDIGKTQQAITRGAVGKHNANVDSIKAAYGVEFPKEGAASTVKVFPANQVHAYAVDRKLTDAAAKTAIEGSGYTVK